MENQTIKQKRTPTPRQKKGAKALMDNLLKDKPESVGMVLKSVGYGTGLQNQPKRVLQSEGFKTALEEYGLTEELITTSLVEDIKAKPKARVKELGLGADILGMRKREEPDKPKSTNVYNFIFNEQFKEKVKPLEDALIEQFKNVKPEETD